MSTSQRRYQVFVSSTYSDLREARQAVTQTLLECDAFPTGMEIFPAADDDAWTLIQSVIDESDYYLLVIAGKYGSVNEATGLSYTEMEYDYAVNSAKPIMAFIHGDLASIPAGLSEREEGRQERLEAFCEKVKKAKHVKFWKSNEELAGQVSKTYNKFVRLYPAVGWVRADQVTSTESLQELVEAKREVAELKAALRHVRIEAPPGTEHLAQGQDKIKFRYKFTLTYRLTGRSSPRSVSTWTNGTTRWDSLFASIAPLLLQEAEEEDLRQGVESFFLYEFFDQWVAEAIDLAKERGDQVTKEEMDVPTIELDDDDLGTILVQLMALGIIRRSDRKRSVSDTGTYWALTPYGEHRTIQLRALKKSDRVVVVSHEEKRDE